MDKLFPSQGRAIDNNNVIYYCLCEPVARGDIGCKELLPAKILHNKKWMDKLDKRAPNSIIIKQNKFAEAR